MKRRRGGIEVEVQTEDAATIFQEKKKWQHMETQTDKASGSSLSAIRELNGNNNNNNNNNTNVNQNRDINKDYRRTINLPSRMIAIGNNMPNVE